MSDSAQFINNNNLIQLSSSSTINSETKNNLNTIKDANSITKSENERITNIRAASQRDEANISNSNVGRGRGRLLALLHSKPNVDNNLLMGDFAQFTNNNSLVQLSSSSTINSETKNNLNTIKDANSITKSENELITNIGAASQRDEANISNSSVSRGRGRLLALLHSKANVDNNLSMGDFVQFTNNNDLIQLSSSSTINSETKNNLNTIKDANSITKSENELITNIGAASQRDEANISNSSVGRGRGRLLTLLHSKANVDNNLFMGDFAQFTNNNSLIQLSSSSTINSETKNNLNTIKDANSITKSENELITNIRAASQRDEANISNSSVGRGRGRLLALLHSKAKVDKNLFMGDFAQFTNNNDLIQLSSSSTINSETKNNLNTIKDANSITKSENELITNIRAASQRDEANISNSSVGRGRGRLLALLHSKANVGNNLFMGDFAQFTNNNDLIQLSSSSTINSETKNNLNTIKDANSITKSENELITNIRAASQRDEANISNSSVGCGRGNLITNIRAASQRDEANISNSSVGRGRGKLVTNIRAASQRDEANISNSSVGRGRGRLLALLHSRATSQRDDEYVPESNISTNNQSRNVGDNNGDDESDNRMRVEEASD
ncbi:unnamed protein product [Arctia plantaginis]|uniref:Uncharacterized protein n=1 Tax=Arctia plantaginis TaxID=874455 RepID=A0A8S1BHU4_ARCPL|nr:unnamed protein product [Arctia plantaginis]